MRNLHYPIRVPEETVAAAVGRQVRRPAREPSRMHSGFKAISWLDEVCSTLFVILIEINY